MKAVLSRKFILTLCGAIALFANKQYDQFVMLVLGYVGVEGAADVISRYKSGTLTALDIENAVSQNDDEPDRNVVITGNTPLFDEEEKKD